MGLSISEVVDLLRFSHTAVYRVYKEWCEKHKTSWGVAVGRNEKRMARLVQADRKATELK